VGGIRLSVFESNLQADDPCGDGYWLSASRTVDSMIVLCQVRNHMNLNSKGLRGREGIILRGEARIQGAPRNNILYTLCWK
jgi:hypothetical protein